MEITRREKIGGKPVVTVERVKANLRLQDDSFNQIIADYIDSAVQTSENYTGVTIAMSKYTLVGVYEAPFSSPVAPVTRVTASIEDVPVDIAVVDGKITLDSKYIGQNVSICIEAGYVDVPADIKTAIVLKASALFLNPVDSADTYAKASDNILKAYRIWR